MYKIVYFGSSHHSLPTLEALHSDPHYEVVGVVSQPDKPVGRKQVLTPTPVSAWAKEHNIALFTPDTWRVKKDSGQTEVADATAIRKLAAEVAVLAYYGKILPQYVIDLFPKGIVNIHPSLLPKYRGPTPGNFVILNGDTVSGVSVMLLAKEMDAGPVLAQREFDVSPTEIPETYYDKGFRIGTELLIETLHGYLEGKIVGQEQDPSQATYTPLLSRDKGKIDWSLSVEELERTVRAFTPWPGTWTEIWESKDGKIYIDELMREKIGLNKDTSKWPAVDKKRLKIHDAVIESGKFGPVSVQVEGETTVSFSKLLSRLG